MIILLNIITEFFHYFDNKIFRVLILGNEI